LYSTLSRTVAELLFELTSQRYERGATVITSNLPSTSGQRHSATSASPARCAIACPTTSTSSRLNGPSYRLAQSRSRKRPN
jgi:DNA replication protein DnaC